MPWLRAEAQQTSAWYRHGGAVRPGIFSAVAVMIDRLDHLVLTVRDVDATCAFYARVLRVRPITFSGGRRALKFGQQKINLHPAGSPFSPHAAQPTPGSADLCFVAATPLQDVIDHLRREGVAIIEGPVRRTGATGPLVSVYFRDPDNNLIEVGSYSDEAGPSALDGDQVVK